ncbi:hypothetical protein J6590_000684 [Homalodisca vitripennis]|nr:hypothetical protein J6590_000684 [Homalodisca vitripennis]
MSVSKLVQRLIQSADARSRWQYPQCDCKHRSKGARVLVFTKYTSTDGYHFPTSTPLLEITVLRLQLQCLVPRRRPPGCESTYCEGKFAPVHLFYVQRLNSDAAADFAEIWSNVRLKGYKNRTKNPCKGKVN